MKLYKKRIDDYKKLIQEQYIRESSVQNVIDRCKGMMTPQENIRISYFEFLYEQFKFIKKRWWVLQGCILLFLWLLLKDSDAAENIGRTMGVFAALFAVLIIPEIWKNRRFSCMEVEGASFYSLRQICVARILLFAIVDLVMVTVFLVITYNTIQISAYRMIMNFLLPFNVSGCICFRCLCSKGAETEYIAVFVSVVWIVIWSAITMHDSIYHMIAEPIWLGLVLLTFGYLIFCVRKSQFNCDIVRGGC
jgi:hypothetical protein